MNRNRDYSKDPKAWKIVKTDLWKVIQKYCKKIQKNGDFLSIDGEKGIGKSTALQDFATKNSLVWYLRGNGQITEKMFTNFMQNILESLKNSQEKHLLIIDDSTKLRQNILNKIMFFYEIFQQRCGIILCGNHLKNKILTGITKSKKGSKDLYIYIQYHSIFCAKNRLMEFAKICRKNGVKEMLEIIKLQELTQGNLYLLQSEIHNLSKP